jgi:tRNA nucleotidyltransferase (CCA-adding enzyme)
MKPDSTEVVKRLRALAEGPRLKGLLSLLGREQSYLVGGTVRDLLLGRGSAADLDLATPLPPDEVRERLERGGIHVVPTGLKHQTVTAVVNESHIEITTFRAAGMKPEGGVVQGSSIEEDLRFRDFTINAIAFAVGSGELIDPLGGIQDLERERIRTCGSPSERFQEDPLRLMRFIRFAVQLHFGIDEKSAAVARTLAEHLAKVSIERIRDEFVKILLSPEPARGMLLLYEQGFLPWVLPELIPSIDCDQNRFHTADVFRHTLDVIEKTEPELLLRLSALFHDIGKPATVSIDANTGDRHFFNHETVGAEIARDAMTRLRFPNDLRDATALLVETHMRPLNAGAPGLRRLLRDTGEYYEHWRKLKEADTLSTRVNPEEFREAMADFDARMEEVKKGPPVSPLASLAVKGRDLIEELGMKQSPEIGVLLRALHEKVLDDPELNTREKLLEIAKDICNKAGQDLSPFAKATAGQVLTPKT